MSARLQYIQSVTDAPVTDWMITRKNSAFPKSLFCCMTNDELGDTLSKAKETAFMNPLCLLEKSSRSDKEVLKPNVPTLLNNVDWRKL